MKKTKEKYKVRYLTTKAKYYKYIFSCPHLCLPYEKKILIEYTIQ